MCWRQILGRTNQMRTLEAWCDLVGNKDGGEAIVEHLRVSLKSELERDDFMDAMKKCGIAGIYRGSMVILDELDP